MTGGAGARIASAAARLAWGAAAIVALLLVLAFLRTDAAGTPLRLMIGALAILAAAAPAEALLVLAGLSPLAAMMPALTGAAVSGTAVIEAMVIATIGPWLARRAFGAAPFQPLPPPARRLARPASVLALLALLSSAVGLSVVALQVGGAGTLAAKVATSFRSDDHARVPALAGLDAALVLGGALGLAVMIAALASERPALGRRLLLMLLAGTAGAATLNLLRLLAAALASELPAQAAGQLWLLARISVHYDRNAAGSVFAMIALVGVGCLAGPRWRRILVGFAVALTTAGLWLTGSRSALAAAAIAAIGLALAVACTHPAARIRRRAAYAGLLLVALAVTGAALYPAARNPGIGGSILGRRELAIAALRMAASHPLFGVGVGRFYELSADYGRPELPSVLPPGSTRENAHNNFLQIFAELGMTGLIAWLWLLAAAVVPVGRLIRAHRDVRAAAALVAGLSAYLLTWLTGHPLLVPEALYPFIIVLGVATAAAPAAVPARAPRAAALLAAAVALLIAITPLRMVAARRGANLEHVGYGVSAWHPDPVVARYRLAEAEASVFVPAGRGSISLPLRRAPGAGPIAVDLLLDGHPADRVRLTSDDWRTVRMVMPGGRAGYRRLDLRARTDEGAGASLMIGRIGGGFEGAEPLPVHAAPAGRGRTAGDYNGNRRTDRLTYLPVSGHWRFLGAQDLATVQHGLPGDRPVPADYSGDGLADVAVYRPASGLWLRRDDAPIQFGDPEDVPVPGDYDGDGRVDIAVYRPTTGTWYVRDRLAIQFGDPRDVPVPADYDGNGSTDIAVYRPDSGTWHVRAQMATQFGEAQDVPLPADYDGNGLVDLAVYRPSTGMWYVRDALAAQYGNRNDIPVPGDYDGDGATDLAVYRPATGDWFIRNQGIAALVRDLWTLLLGSAGS